MGRGCLRGVSVAVDDLVAVRRRSREAMGVSSTKEVVVGGGELDDGGVLARSDGTYRLSRAAGVDQDRAVGVRHHPPGLLIQAGAAGETLAPAGVDDGRALLLETCVLARKAGAETLAGGHAVVWVEDAALAVVVGVRGQAQDLGEGKADVVRFELIYGLRLNGWSCGEVKGMSANTYFTHNKDVSGRRVLSCYLPAE